MNEQVLKEIEHRLNRAGKFMLTRAAKPGNLVVEDGFYSNPDDCHQITVLEALVLGQEASGDGSNSDMLIDAANSLTADSGWPVTPDVIAGFIAGLDFKHGFLGRK